MRKTRFIANGRCYHLISRLAHQAFFLDDDEKTLAVELLRRVEEFSGVIVLAYAIMSNHFHIFIYVPEAEELGDEEILRRINALYREASLVRVLGEWTRLKDEEAKLLAHARPTKKCVSRFGEYRKSFLRRMWNSSEFMRTYKQHFTRSRGPRSCGDRPRKNFIFAAVLPRLEKKPRITLISRIRMATRAESSVASALFFVGCSTLLLAR